MCWNSISISIRLEDTRTTFRLYDLFQTSNDAGDERRKSLDHKNLNQIEKDPIKHGGLLLSRRQSDSALDEENLPPSGGCECKYSLALWR